MVLAKSPPVTVARMDRTETGSAVAESNAAGATIAGINVAGAAVSDAEDTFNPKSEDLSWLGAIPKRKKGCEVQHSATGENAQRFPLGEDSHVDTGMLPQVIQCVSLLNQFANPKVRADLVNGEFGGKIDCNILPMLDELRWTLLPQWQGSPLGQVPLNCVSASVHMQKLCLQGSDKFQQDAEESLGTLTYSNWFDVLSDISRSQYWSRTTMDKRCTHILDGKSDLIHQEDQKPVFPQKPLLQMRKRSSLGRVTRGKSRKVEEVVLSSTSSSSLSTEDSSSSCESSATSSSGDDRHTRRRKDKREVVTPPPFLMDGKQQLKDYLATYESYFSSKFRGNSYDKCQQLEAFLTGDLLNVYKVCGGRRLKYRQMKERLLSYYKKQKIGGKTYWKKQFDGATPNFNESLDLFGIRLKELAEMAFPKSTKECAEHLRKHFLTNIPTRTYEKILELEKGMKATSGGKKKRFNFATIMQLAVDLMPQTPNPPSIMWADKLQTYDGPQKSGSYKGQERPYSVEFNSQRDSRNLGAEGGNLSRPARSYWSPNHRNRPQNERRWSPRSPESYRNEPRKGWSSKPQQRKSGEMNREGPCNFCGRNNHQEENCWRANNSCLICGRGHSMKDCSHYNPRFGRSQRSQSKE